MTSRFAEEYLPVFDVSTELATVVKADSDATWKALMAADLIELGRRRPMLGLLGALRALPEIAGHVLHGEHPQSPPAHLTLRGTTELPADAGGWVLLGEREREEIALGLVGKFWRPTIDYARLSASEFPQFAEPGYAKTVYALGVRELGPGETLLWAQMRTATADERARRWFRRYWTFGVGSGAQLLVGGLLDLVREDAEGERVRAPRPTGVP